MAYWELVTPGVAPASASFADIHAAMASLVGSSTYWDVEYNAASYGGNLLVIRPKTVGVGANGERVFFYEATSVINALQLGGGYASSGTSRMYMGTSGNSEPHVGGWPDNPTGTNPLVTNDRWTGLSICMLNNKPDEIWLIESVDTCCFGYRDGTAMGYLLAGNLWYDPRDAGTAIWGHACPGQTAFQINSWSSLNVGNFMRNLGTAGTTANCLAVNPIADSSNSANVDGIKISSLQYNTTIGYTYIPSTATNYSLTTIDNASLQNYWGFTLPMMTEDEPYQYVCTSRKIGPTHTKRGITVVRDSLNVQQAILLSSSYSTDDKDTVGFFE